MKTIEEKCRELEEYCNARGGCSGCPLTICHSTIENFYGMTDSKVNACYAQLLELTATAPVEPETVEPETVPSIRDSGARTEFPTGAVRDIQEGKGRCDLMPLDVVARIMGEHVNNPDHVLIYIHHFQTSGHTGALYGALERFASKAFAHVTVGTSCCHMCLETSKHFEEGAKKYGEHNWQKGIPLPRYIDSAARHYLKWLRGDKDEPHDRAFCWNIMCAIWTCCHMPELNTYRKDVESC